MAIEPRFTPDMTLADAARLLPEAVSVFEDTEIDYSCQGARSLADAATEAGYTVEKIIGLLQSVPGRKDGATNWFEEPLTSLMQYLGSDHRGTLGDRIPALHNAIEKAIAENGDKRELQRIKVLFGYLASAMSTHVLNEERDLFPFITHLDAANNDSIDAPVMRISQRVLRELVEHESFRDRLRTLRELAERLPATSAVKTLRDDLRHFSNEVNLHMHLENNVLYPRAIDIENGLRRPAMTA
jgi:regulator of cell morphogenesis and NO signaling